MVKFWDIQIDKGIALTRKRIKHLELHGKGAAMQEKEILKKQLRHRELRLAK